MNDMSAKDVKDLQTGDVIQVSGGRATVGEMHYAPPGADTSYPQGVYTIVLASGESIRAVPGSSFRLGNS